MQTYTIQDIVNIHMDGRLDEAENLYLAGVGQNPEDWVLLFHLSLLYQQQQKPALAAIVLERAHVLNPGKYEICSNLGILYRMSDQYDKAQHFLSLAMKLSKGVDPDVYVNLGSLYVNEGNPEDGEKVLRDGLKVDDSNHLAHWNLSLCLLEQGKWGEAWEHYLHGKYPHESKFAAQGEEAEGLQPQTTPSERPLRWPLSKEWNRERSTVLLYGEQGLGDEIMFMSMLADAQKDADNIILECHPRLEPMVNRCFPAIKTYPTRKMAVLEEPMASFDHSRALGDLGCLYRLDADSFPGTKYVSARAPLVKEYREKLEALGPGPYYGIGWRGGYIKTKKKLRSLKLTDFLPILEQGGQFISMQYDEPADAEVKAFCKEHNVTIHHWPEIIRADDYDHTAALAMALDEVICCNTTLVHLCGALGRSCWSLTPKRPAWRYQLKGDMPWYKSVTLLRQENDQDWTHPVQEAIKLMKQSEVVIDENDIAAVH